MAAQSLVLVTLTELAGKEADQAAEKLVALNKLLEDAQVKLTMLTEYRNDYMAKLARDLETGMDAQSYQNFQSFIRKLDQAVGGQQESVELARSRVSAQRIVWQECQKKKLSYEVLAERSEKKAHQQEQKRDQKLMDEHAMRSSRQPGRG
ncbi:MAG TPA: flagellar export protein FliJ [Methylovorus sp.]|jgi:flagellar protein FliJ|nr:flagellar export protein FliJ [Methylovorus sp.]